MRGFVPYWPPLLLATLEWFYPTLVVEILVVGAVAARRWRERRMTRFGRALLARLEEERRFVPALAVADSRLWALPFLVWSLQAVRRVEYFIIGMSSGLTSPGIDFAWEAFFSVALSLAALVLLQTAAVAALSGGRPGLGVSGALRVAVRYSVITVILDGFFYFGLWNWALASTR